jgi:hypothetical protein
MIDKTLLSEILDTELLDQRDTFEPDDNSNIYYLPKDGNGGVISIYKLKDLCKEKARDRGYYIYSGPKGKKLWTAWYSEGGSGFDNIYSVAGSEEYAVISIFKDIVETK